MIIVIIIVIIIIIIIIIIREIKLIRIIMVVTIIIFIITFQGGYMIIKEGCFTEGAQDFFLTPNKESSGPEVKESTLLSYNLPYHP